MTRFSPRLVLVAAAVIFALMLGTRQSMSLFIGSINTATGLGFAGISLAFAIAQLVWGLSQPVAGACADRYGSGRVIGAGILMVALGTALTPLAHTQWMLILTLGVLTAAGAGFAGPSVLMASLSRQIPPQQRGMATGLVNAGGSLGQFIIAPFAGWMLVNAGWINAVTALAFLALLALPLAVPLKGRHEKPHAAAPEQSMGEAVRIALGDPSYLLLSAGFFVCGFHVAFIAVHMPGVIALCGLPPEVGAWSLAVIGLFNIAGSFGVGWAMGRWRMKSLLSLIYAVRAAAVMLFLLAPKTQAVVLVFSAVIGVTYLSTVPPTAGLVAKFYGIRYMATLFGLVFFSHQVGGFLGAWLGGKAFQATHSYDWMWYADIALAIFAALIHMPIREQRILAAAPA